MRRTIVIIPLLISLAMLGGCTKLTSAVKSRFTNGEKEIKSAYRAKAAARSWRMKTQLAVHDDKVMETEFEISCPDRERIVNTVGNDKHEMIRIGKRFYAKNEGKWYYKDVDDANWSPCGTNSGARSPWAMLNEGREMVTVFANTKDKFAYSRGEATQVGSTSCQDWHVDQATAAASGTHGLSYIVCISRDHLPVRVVMGQGGLITDYTDWNQPISIEAPADAVAYVPPAAESNQPASPQASHHTNP